MSTGNSPYTSGQPPPRKRHVAVGANPLRRPSDRFEAWFHRLLTLVLLIGLPLAAVGAGLTAYESTMRTVHAQTAQRHEVTARLTSNVAGDSEVTKEPAQVRWTEQNGTVRTGTTLVKPGTPQGSTLRIWVDRDGTITSAPANATTAWSNGFFVGGMAALGTFIGIHAVRAAVGRLLDRRRYARWDVEWDLVEPTWSARFRR
ncbi:Rv1733c family protein [Streptomyces massasporeus]